MALEADREDQKKLMRRVDEGSSGAAAELLDGYGGPVFRFILGRGGGPSGLGREDAEEILQDTFLAAVRSAGRFVGQSSLLTWLCGIARHKLADHFRRLGRQPPVTVGADSAAQADLGAQADPAAQADPGERLALREAVDLALDGISVGFRSLLLAKYERGRTMEELAVELGTTTKAVESKLGRARAAFAESFRTVWGGDYR